MRTRTGRLLAGAVIVAALVSGCGSGVSRVDAAAVVGSETLSLSDVQPRITAALARPELVDALRTQGVGAPEIGRSIVTQQIRHALLARAAAEQNIVVRDDEVDAAIAQAGGVAVVEQSALDATGVREQVRDQLIAARLAEREIDRLELVADIAVVRSREEALQLGAALAQGGATADRALDALPTAQRDQPIRPAATPQAASTPLIGLAAGDAAAFPIGSQEGWVVVRVSRRTTDARPAGGPAATRLDPQTLAEAGLRLLTPLAARTDITVNPRYGTWDPVELAVVADANQTGQLFPAARAAS